VEIGRNTTDHLRLEIVGYQFAAAKDAWDANWLRVHVRASVDGREWDSIDPCLLTSEVSEIAVWLEYLADGMDVAPLEFLEPELVFDLVGRDGDLIRLRVWFAGGLRPSWAPYDAMPSRDLAAEIAVTREELTRAAADLREQVRRFPDRPGVGLR